MTTATSTFNDGTDDYVPIVVDGFEAGSEGGSIVRRLPFSGVMSVVLRPGSSGAGTLRCGWDTVAEARAMKDALNAGVMWTFTDSEHGTDLDMSFIVTQAAFVIDDETRDGWWTVFDYQEVAP